MLWYALKKGVHVKLIFAFLLITVFPLSARATVLVSPPEPDATGEVITMMVGTIAAVGNVMMIVNRSPSYWVGALGTAAGTTALILRGQPDAVHESGLMAVGLLGLASGAVAMRYRYVLNHNATQLSIAPAFHEGSTGLAVVVDF
jgi:hypothetical protein